MKKHQLLPWKNSRWSLAERCFTNSRCNVYKRNTTINHSPQPVAKTSLTGLTLLIRFLYIINAQSRNKFICFRHNWKVLLSYSTSHFWQTSELFQLKYCMLWLHISTTQINSGIRKQNCITWNKLTSYIDRMAQLTQFNTEYRSWWETPFIHLWFKSTYSGSAIYAPIPNL